MEKLNNNVELHKIKDFIYVTNQEIPKENDIILSSFDNWKGTNTKYLPMVSRVVKIEKQENSFFVNFLTNPSKIDEIDLRTNDLAEWEIENENGNLHKKIIATNNPKLIKLGIQQIK